MRQNSTSSSKQPLISGGLFVERLEQRVLFNVSILADINQGTLGSSPNDAATINGTMMFFATDATQHSGLWATDGTAAGTHLLKQFDVGHGTSEVLGSEFFFMADDGTGWGLWKSDGTTAGTQMVTNSGQITGSSSELTVAGGKLFFDIAGVGGGVWVSDGTAAGTTRLAVGYSIVSQGNRVLFVETAGPTGYASLWASDGTARGTYMVHQFINYSGIQYLTAVGNTAFVVTTEPGDSELWELNSAGQVVPLLRVPNPNGASFITAAAGTSSTFYFVINSEQLWKSDGTVGGTELVKDLYNDPLHAYSPTNFIDDGNIMFFSALLPVERGTALFRTDGTAAGTIELGKYDPTINDFNFRPSFEINAGELYFSGSDGLHGFQPWESDGTVAGTAQVAVIDPEARDRASFSHDQLLMLSGIGGKMAFAANDGIHGQELWITDGTANGTHLVIDLNTAAAGSNPQQHTSSGGNVFFSADDGIHGDELWRTDGTSGGTALVADINPEL